VNKEQTTHYHIACYNCFLLAGLLGRANDFDFPPEFWQRLEDAANFICALTTDGVSVPHIGDRDDGKTVMLSETHRSQIQSLLATAAVLFNRSDFKTKAREFDEMSLWLLGRTGRTKFQSLDEAKAEGEKPLRFDEGGYYILQADRPVPTKLVFDAGPLGLGSIAAHGHADALSFVLYVGGMEFLIDPGTYTFVAEHPYRKYFRSTAAHNTVVIDGKDQSEMGGPFLWTRKAESVLEEFLSTQSCDRMVASHNGYSSLPDPVVHRRTIEFDKRYATITIRDDIESTSRHTVALFSLSTKLPCAVNKTERVAGIQWKLRDTADRGSTITLRCSQGGRKSNLRVGKRVIRPESAYQYHRMRRDSRNGHVIYDQNLSAIVHTDSINNDANFSKPPVNKCEKSIADITTSADSTGCCRHWLTERILCAESLG
jgi:hypothetical protein